jgi:voltage-gated potassium channel
MGLVALAIFSERIIMNIAYNNKASQRLHSLLALLDHFILLLILVNVVAVIISTDAAIYAAHSTFFDSLELFSIIVFAIEYVVRLWTCTRDPRYSSPILGRIRYALRPMAIIDLLAILPFFIPVMGVDLRFIRAVRLFRLFRIFKLGRYSTSLLLIARVLKAKKEEIGITLFAGAIILLIASSLVYISEHPHQPEAFASIPDAMWWGVATLTTVGYGDVYPITGMGKLLASFIAVLGIGLFALPTGILASGFAEELEHKKHHLVCPNCGEEIR